MNDDTGYDSKEGKTFSAKKSRGTYICLILFTITFILYYSTPINLSLKIVKSKNPPIRSAWTDYINEIQQSSDSASLSTENTIQTTESNHQTNSIPTFVNGDSLAENTDNDATRTTVRITDFLTDERSDENEVTSEENDEFIESSAEKSTDTVNTIYERGGKNENTLRIISDDSSSNEMSFTPTFPTDHSIPSIVTSFTASKNSHKAKQKTTTFIKPQKISDAQTTKYLINSKNCKIPHFDPFDSSVKSFIEYKAPLDCSNYPALTYSNGSFLMVNETIAISRGYENFTCCYTALYRQNEEGNDNLYRTDSKCKTFTDHHVIKDEFIKVECETDVDKKFYENYHSFIHEKPTVEERCKNSSAKYSVLVIGVDSMSRMNMHRQLNKTLAFLVDKLEPIEMLGFNKVGDNTFPNLVPIMTGYNESELLDVCWKSNKNPLDDCDFIWKKFQKKGYRTLYAEDTPRISSFNYVKRGFYKQPTDYYFRPFILAYEKNLGRRKLLNCYTCVGSVSETEAVLHWTKEFALLFKEKPYFSFSWINSLTHDFLNGGSSSDHMYLDFFQTLHATGGLNNTIVILMGDHGMRWGAIRTTYIGRLEERLPMLVFLVPRKFREDYPEETRNLERNSKRLVTPFDIHATLDHLIHLREEWNSVDTKNVPQELIPTFTKRAVSLLKPVPEDRSCEDASILEHWCTCDTFLEADPNSNEVRAAALSIIHRLNTLLKPKAKICSRLHLIEIKSARVIPPKRSDKKPFIGNIYTVIVETSPGNGLFEGTAQLNEENGDLKLLGSISRLNLYRNQSICVDDAILKKYCYCISQVYPKRYQIV